MAKVSKSDLSKRKSRLEALTKSLDDNGRVSDKKLLSDLRGAIRQVWRFHPTKLSLLLKNTIVDNDPNTRTKWLHECSMCANLFKGSDIEVDHIKGENSLLSFEDLETFAKSIIGVGWDDLQLLCKPCHEIKSYQERYNLTFEEAKKEKAVIAITKLTAGKQKKWLTDNGVKKPASNLEGRTKQIREVLKNRGEI